MARTALITGVNGQDGSYLAEYLLAAGYEVHGLARPGSSARPLEHLANRPFTLHRGDLTDRASLTRVIEAVAPAEIYNLAACSFVPDSWNATAATSDVTALGAARLLECIRDIDRGIRFCQAGSSQMFGRPEQSPQNEDTPLRPVTPYAAAKCYAHWLTAAYRERFGIFACNAVLFNHESPRRGPRFVTRKITQAAARIRRGRQQTVALGQLDARRDWGFAGDYVRALALMLQHEHPDDYVVGSGTTHTVRDWLELAFSRLGLDYHRHVEVDPQFVRPVEPVALVADPSKARRQLGWEPEVDFPQLVQTMVDADLRDVDEASSQ